MSAFSAYIQMTKPTIIVLVAVTGLATLLSDGIFFAEPLRMSFCMVLIIMAAGSANAFNQLIDHDIDSIMERTRKRRPLPQQHLSPRHAMIFASLLGLISTAGLWIFFNGLSALISLGTILFYIVIYTLWLKRRHPYNIVIGGVAGSTAPLIASAAAHNSITAVAWLGFTVIFMWTPPHFWALALAIKDDYAKAGIPMLPNVCGDKRTKIEIVVYTLLLFPLTVLSLVLLKFHMALIVMAVLLWAWYFFETLRQIPQTTKAAYYRLFYVSIFYLFFYFIVLATEGVRHFISGLET